MDDENTNRLLQFLDYEGQLHVGLNRETFEHIFQELRRASESSEIAEIDIDEVHEIAISDLSRFKHNRNANNGWKDKIALWGCGIVAFLVLLFFILGIIAVLGIIPLPR